MHLRRLLNLALAVVLAIALALAPVAAPVAAAGPQAAGMSMSADMPCCPDQQQNKDCQDCPLVALCLVKTTQASPSVTAALPLRYPVRTTHTFRNDVRVTGLARPPPDYPPRNPV